MVVVISDAISDALCQKSNQFEVTFLVVISDAISDALCQKSN